MAQEDQSDWIMGALAAQDGNLGMMRDEDLQSQPVASFGNRLLNETLPGRMIGSAYDAAKYFMQAGHGDIALPPVGSRREDYTDIPPPSEPQTAMGKMFDVAPVAWSPQDEMIGKAGDLAGLMTMGSFGAAPAIEGGLGMGVRSRPVVQGFSPKQAPAEGYDFLTGQRPNAPYPQFAERYPDTGPPTMTPKTNPSFPGETFPAKTLTPEAEDFAKAREKIIDDMRENSYQPFFDPSQRFPADFAAQPGPHVDTAGALAAKQSTIDKHLEVIGAPETRQALRDAYSKGLDLPDSQAWYYLGQVERKMKQDLGEEAGAKRFRDQMATAMSATTTGMTPQQNLIMSQYLNHLKATGQPLPTASYQTPVTVGGQRTMPNVQAYDQLFSGPSGPYETLQAQAFQNPKRADFAQAQMGNPNAFTVDEQMAHGMIGKDVPQKGTYGLITNVGREEAAKAGVDPQRYQDVAWAGFKKMLEEESRAKKGWTPYGPGEGYQGKPMISEINDMIERTHRLTGMPRQTIWERGFLRNEIPLYGVGGAAVMGELAAQDRTQD
jgi:hypothetical protein